MENFYSFQYRIITQDTETWNRN